ncbi:magnesium-translocating P-type ATPase [Fusarium beomiforme]|uniref:Magnesium-transporting ATPase, P-type 1 n=1 Tax=Fusarium beomiforme TaxID=44412 RepID=A0A9P5A7Z8_9HYPO|nr:magnesium-translocating P-type ATPase [Fusarium beomiforme]
MARVEKPLLSRLGLRTGNSRARKAAWQLNPERATKNTPEDVLRWVAFMAPDTALGYLVSSHDGISEAEATKRRRIQGENVVSSRKPQSWFMLLLSVIPNPFNILLVFLAILNVAMPDPSWEGFAVLMVMIVISVAVRFWQEFQSGVAIFRLQSAIIPKIRVRRPATSTDELQLTWTESAVLETDLVPGDVVVLVPGAIVPADCLILESSYLRISQSAWTGESEPVGKDAGPHDAKEAFSIFDFSNVALMGTNIVSGHGIGLVLRTGDDAMIATMVKEVEKKRQPNAFQKGILNVTWMLIGFMVVMVPIVLCISGKVTGDWKNAALFSISVAVGLVPEMLPAIVNANLARAAHQLSKKQAIVKRLDSVQNLGAMTVLCSDKTGTLTKDELSVHKYTNSEGEDNLNIMELAKIDSHIQGNSGNNMDRAIINYHLPNGDEVGVAHYEQVRVIPFDFENRRSGCIVRGITGQYLLIIKGAFDEVLTRCSSMRSGGKSEYLSTEMQSRWRRLAMQKNMEGYRVLLVASRNLDKSYVDELDMLETNMTLEGMISFSDPPKDDAKDAIASLTELGVRVKVLTGDSLPVALNICRSLELLQNTETTDDDAEAISGPELALLEDSDEFDLAVERCSVFAKVTPKQKSMIVLSLQKAGNCIGMLGDGINDCGALRDADVGISVDSGAGVAKDCADLIMTEKGLSIIVRSVVLGRITHGNTIKYIKMVASSNFGNVFSILAASAWLPYTPMTSIQLLAQNLLYDISQIAIPWDRVDQEYLVRPRQWNAKDILKFIVVLGPTSSVIDMCTFSLNWFYYGIRTTDDNVKLAQTHWFLEGLLTQTLIVHLLRTAKVPFIQSRAAPILVFSTASIMAIGFVLPWIPAFRPAFSFAQPAPTFVGFLAAELLLYAVEVQIVKIIYIKIFGVWL